MHATMVPAAIEPSRRQTQLNDLRTGRIDDNII